MQQNWRKSIWSKLVAAGFISMILIGNIWFIQNFTKHGAPSWVQDLFTLNIAWLAITGIGLANYAFWNQADTNDEA